ncbi:MAG: hypothetical protein DMG72_04715 [Acidobacteria bacterium]|nr:MAG: hypothetical protein DMG72_04715 [Acidobacteriota bacterium]
MLTRYEDVIKERQLAVARIAMLAVMPSLTVADLAEIMKVEREYHEKKSATEPILARTAVLLRDGRLIDAGYLQDNPEHVEAMLEDCGRHFSAVLAAVYMPDSSKHFDGGWDNAIDQKEGGSLPMTNLLVSE